MGVARDLFQTESASLSTEFVSFSQNLAHWLSSLQAAYSGVRSNRYSLSQLAMFPGAHPSPIDRCIFWARIATTNVKRQTGLVPESCLVDQGPDLQNILRQSYDYLTIMPNLGSTYDRRFIHKTSYELDARLFSGTIHFFYSLAKS